MNQDKRRRIYALISAYIMLIGCYFSSWKKQDVVYNESYQYQSSDPYAYFGNGKVYICDEYTIGQIRDDSTNDFYIVDSRSNRDPDIKICNSYEVLDPIKMYKLLNILLRYESEYPSEWNRSLISMILEWMGHNFGYYSNIEQHRTSEVDLNNADENKYSLLNKK